MVVTLYHFGMSPPSRCALLALRAAGVRDVRVQVVDLFKKEQLDAAFVAKNPQHCVPTLDDDGFVVWESRAIAKYVAVKYDKSGRLYPQADARAAATVDRLLYFDAGSLFPSMRAIAFSALFLGERKITQDRRDKVNENLGFLNAFLEGNKWVAGTPDHTVADLSILATIYGFYAAGWNFKPYPNVLKWLENCSSIPGYDENKEGAVAFGNAVKGKLDEGEIY